MRRRCGTAHRPDGRAAGWPERDAQALARAGPGAHAALELALLAGKRG
jgi:hypothetical protein